MLAGRAFFFFGRLVTRMNKGGRERRREREKKGLKGGKKKHIGKQLSKRSNTGEGDTLRSCMRCHGYQSPVCHPFLAFPPLFSPDILAFERERKDTKGGERKTR